MNLNDLKLDYDLVEGSKNTEITGITNDSRTAKPGDLFVAIVGSNKDGHDYLKEAIQRGAVAVLVEKAPTEKLGATVLKVKDTKKILAPLATQFYNHPTDKFFLAGVTGTKGKTTVTHMIKHVLDDSEISAGLIGTTGIYYNGKHFSSANTTPDALELQKLFRNMVEAEVAVVVMEVSSTAFKQERVGGLIFNSGAFLNISADHVGKNEHESFEDYLNCKKRILDCSLFRLVNKDESLWNRLSEAQKEKAFTFAIEDPTADFYAFDLKKDFNRQIFKIRDNLRGEETIIELPMNGTFNVENALAAYAILRDIGISCEQIAGSLKSVQVPDRDNYLSEVKSTNVYIDYAHNEASVTAYLTTLKDLKPDKLTVLFTALEKEVESRRRDVARAIKRYSDDFIFIPDHKKSDTYEKNVIGPLLEEIPDIRIIDDLKDALEEILKSSGKNDIVAILAMDDAYRENNGKLEKIDTRALIHQILDL